MKGNGTKGQDYEKNNPETKTGQLDRIHSYIYGWKILVGRKNSLSAEGIQKKSLRKWI